MSASLTEQNALASPHRQIIDRDTASAFTDQLQGLLMALTSHLKRETNALRTGSISTAVDHETKASLFHDYHAALKHLQANKDAVSRFAPVKVDELRRTNETFQNELQKNLASVTTAKAISEHLLTRLAESASTTRRPKTYTAGGTVAQPGQAAAISYDRAL